MNNSTMWDADPFIGCPFDRSELEEVDEALGFRVGQDVNVQDVGDVWKKGTIVKIGSKAQYGKGEYFTVFAVYDGEYIYIKTEDQLRAIT